VSEAKFGKRGSEPPAFNIGPSAAIEGGRPGGSCVNKGKSLLFLKKKKQKDFYMLGTGRAAATHSKPNLIKVFFASFFFRKKKTLPLPAYLPALDGLRALAILVVIASHCGLDHLIPGAFGVTLFFFLSGFLITRQLLATHGKIDFARFYLRRALRLMPAATAYILLAGAAFIAIGGHIALPAFLAALFHGSNFYDLVIGYHSPFPAIRHPFNILWSLAIEEHFYLLWPALIALIPHRRALFATLLAICGATLLWRLTLFDLCFIPGAPAFCGSLNPNPLFTYNRLYIATDTRLDSLAYGAALAVAATKSASNPRALVGLTLLALSFAFSHPLARYVFRPAIQGIGLSLLFPALLTHGRAAQILAHKIPVFIGRLSYSLYLWHWGAMMLADALAPPRFHPAWLATTLTLTALFALASYYIIERPLLRLRRHFGSHAPS